MKHFFTLILVSFVGMYSFSQWTTRNFSFESLNREFRIYVPANYSSSNPAALVFTLHGLGDDMANFSNIGMDNIADTANIIVVCPQAIIDPFLGSSAWNSGAGYSWFSPNSSVNDVGFINALIDSVSSEYAINPNKIFSCGFSMGGFMTQRLAIELNDRIKSFASVAGTFGNAIMPIQNPGRAVSIAHFHGTADSTILYNGNTWGNDVDALIDFWVQNNMCNVNSIQSNLPNLSNDGYTIEHFEYNGGNNSTSVELFKVNNANHTWLSTGNDIDYATEIWKFFNKSSSQNASVSLLEEDGFSFFPNPTNDKLQIVLSPKLGQRINKISLRDNLGKEINSYTLYQTQTEFSIDLTHLEEGVYFLSLQGSDVNLLRKVIRN